MVSSQDIFAELSLTSLTEFYKRVTGDLNDYKELVSTKAYDREKVDEETINLFMAEQKLRTFHLEEIIDSHLTTLLRFSSKSKMAKTDEQLLAKYAKYSYTERLTLLLANQSKLMKQTNSLRMQGTT